MYQDDDILIENEFLVDVRGIHVARAVVKVAIVTGYFEVCNIIMHYDPQQIRVYNHHGRDVTHKFVSNVL